MTGAAADNLRQDLATLDRIRSGLLRVQIAYSKANRGAAKGGAPRREMQAETLRGLANAYSGVMGSLPTVTIGGAGEGARGHFVEVVTVACQEAGKPGVFTESDFVTLRNGIKAKREQG